MTSKQALNRFNSFRKKAIFLFGAYNKPEIRKSMVFETILLNRPYHFFAFFFTKTCFFYKKVFFYKKCFLRTRKTCGKISDSKSKKIWDVGTVILDLRGSRCRPIVVVLVVVVVLDFCNNNLDWNLIFVLDLWSLDFSFSHSEKALSDQILASQQRLLNLTNLASAYVPRRR